MLERAMHRAKIAALMLKRKILKYLIRAGLFFIAIIVGINLYIVESAKSSIFVRIEQLPDGRVGLLLGTDFLRRDGSTNLHFLNRINSAAKVCASGKIKVLIISGSKNNKGFNEVLGMQKALESRGVPKETMILDFEGNRTLESVRHASQDFHLQKVLIITDDFHAPRAIFLCRRFGVDALAFSPGEEPLDHWYFQHRLRKYFARVKAVIDTIFQPAARGKSVSGITPGFFKNHDKVVGQIQTAQNRLNRR
jgi:SanA protein